jgi:hypothetical protein
MTLSMASSQANPATTANTDDRRNSPTAELPLLSVRPAPWERNPLDRPGIQPVLSGQVIT